MPPEWINLEREPALLRGTVLSPRFSVDGKGNELLKGNDVYLVFREVVYKTNIVVPQSPNSSWKYNSLALLPDSDYAYPSVPLSKLVVTFHADLLSSSEVAAADLPLVNSGLLNADGESDESFQGVFPASELAKLNSNTWYIARITGYPSNELLSLCQFYCIGGL